MRRGLIHGIVPLAALLALGACQDDVVRPDLGDVALARGAPGPPPGQGGGGGGGGGGGKGETFAELMIILRAEDGLPITEGRAWTDEHGVTTYCVQPVTEDLAVPHPDFVMGVAGAPATIEPIRNPVDGKLVTLVPIYAQYDHYLPPPEEETEPDEGGGGGGGGGKGNGKGGKAVAAAPSPDEEAAPGPCDVILFTRTVVNPETGLVTVDTLQDYAPYASEAELERLNLARAPDNVLRRQMVEVETLFRTTDPYQVTLDPAGRPVFAGVMMDATPKLQGIHEALLETGTIPGTNGLPYPFPFQLVGTGFTQWTTWDLSSFALGGAASKFGRITVDAVLYHDRVMSIPTTTHWASTLYHDQLKETFIDYRGFTYDRAAAFPGCVTYIDKATLQWTVGSYLDVVDFVDLGPGAPATRSVAGYAQMADDGRAVILFVHENDALIDHARMDPVGVNTCDAQRAALATP